MFSSASPGARGAILSAGAGLLAAVFVVAYKEAADTGHHDEVVFVMLLVAAVLNTLTAIPAGRRSATGGSGPARLDVLQVAIAAALGVLTILGNVSVTESLARLDPGIASVALQTQVLIVTVIAWLVLGERITGRFAAGTALALAGFVVMRTPAAGTTAVSSAGLAWAVGAAASFALMQILNRRYAARIEPLLVNALRLWIAVGLLAVVVGGASGVTRLSARGWIGASTAAFAGPFLSRICLMYAVRYIPAGRVAVIALVQPVLAFVLAFAVSGTVPTPLELAGGAIILAGVALPVIELVGAPRR